jgi:NAD(P)-dependent dehydrogenase (short-subunit alcohol dehydrogenase family)
MKVLVVGATGTIGKAVVAALNRHEVIRVARKGADIHADILDEQSIHRMFERAGKVDALVSAAGSGSFKPLRELTNDDFELSLRDKLMGQVNLVRFGIPWVTESFTLTSGVLSSEPAPGSAAISLVNAALEGFGRAAAIELAPVRVNVVSPPWVSETLQAMGMDASGGMPAADVARSYVRAVQDRAITGQVIDSREG